MCCVYDWFAISASGGLCTNFCASAATSSEELRTVSRQHRDSYTSQIRPGGGGIKRLGTQLSFTIRF